MASGALAPFAPFAFPDHTLIDLDGNRGSAILLRPLELIGPVCCRRIYAAVYEGPPTKDGGVKGPYALGIM